MKDDLPSSASASIKPKSTSKQGSLLKLWGTPKSSVEAEIAPPIETSSASISAVDTVSDVLPKPSTGPRVLNVTFDLEDPKLNGEGRTITIEFDSFFLVACYVPNSGQDLQRLNYRLQEW